MTADELASILSAVAWPATVLLLVLAFKDDISELLKRVEKAKLPGGEFSFYGEAFIDKPGELPPPPPMAEPAAAAEQPEAKPIKWGNTGNLFWAAHDLMWTIDVVLRGAPRGTIVHGLRQSMHHVRSLGISDHHIEKRLYNLVRGAEHLPEEQWTTLIRNNYAHELASLVRHLGDLAEANQPNFEPGPKE